MHALPLHREQAISSLRSGRSNNEHFRFPEQLLNLEQQQVHILSMFICSRFSSKILTRASRSTVRVKLEVILSNAWHRAKQYQEVTSHNDKQWTLPIYCGENADMYSEIILVTFHMKLFLCPSITIRGIRTCKRRGGNIYVFLPSE
jgi:hypothetical protein